MKNYDYKKIKLISIDFDGVLASYNGYKGPNHFGKPASGAKTFIKNIIKAGLTPIVHTTRPPLKIKKWLKENNFPALEVTNYKHPSVVYIDDRAVKFNGSFKDLTKDLKKFKVHWKHKTATFKNLK